MMMQKSVRIEQPGLGLEELSKQNIWLVMCLGWQIWWCKISQIAWSWLIVNSHGFSVGSRRAEKTMNCFVTPKHFLAQNALAKLTVLFLIASCTCSFQRLGTVPPANSQWFVWARMSTISPESRHQLQCLSLDSLHEEIRSSASCCSWTSDHRILKW